jgi:eukaryotic-like serine/threonine-protein kinase
VAAGQIVEQQPAAGADVQPGSEVSVAVSSGPELSTVPNVVGQPAPQAKVELWNALFASTVVTVPSSEPEGTVVSTDPPAGTRADWRAISVTVNVSAGPPPEITPAPPDRQPNLGPDGAGPGSGGADGGRPGDSGPNNQNNQKDNKIVGQEDRGKGKP